MKKGVTLSRLYGYDLSALRERRPDIPHIVTSSNVNDAVLMRIALQLCSYSAVSKLIEFGLDMHQHLGVFVHLERMEASPERNMIYMALLRLAHVQGIHVKPFLLPCLDSAFKDNQFELAKTCTDLIAIPLHDLESIEDTYRESRGHGFLRDRQSILSYWGDVYRRDLDCKNALVTLLGLSGRWRRFGGGQFRDVFTKIAKTIWFNLSMRRSTEWTNAELEEYNIKRRKTI